MNVIGQNNLPILLLMIDLDLYAIIKYKMNNTILNIAVNLILLNTGRGGPTIISIGNANIKKIYYVCLFCHFLLF